jgi:hypothetical protein
MNWFFGESVSKTDLRSWVMDALYRIDAGLFEMENEYGKKKIITKLEKDVAYNQLRGKFHAYMMALNDFKLSFNASPRLQARMRLHGAKVNKVKLPKEHE